MPIAKKYSSLPMVNYKTHYKCHKCGTPSYQRVIERDASGALRPSGAYRCAGCRSIFETLRAWWEPKRNVDFQPSAMHGA
jgi:DNA-directed RNA polymerase subunit RPC12/RpoP